MSPRIVGGSDRVDRSTVGCEICGGRLKGQRLSSTSLLLHCTRCGHVLRDLQLCPAGARRKVFGGSSGFDRFRLFFTRRQLIKLLSSLPRGRPLEVLEVGFAGGQLLRTFQDLGHRIYGVEVCRPRNPAVEELVAQGAQLFFDGLENARLPQETMDLIYLVHVAEHLPDPWESFRILARCARPGALLYLLTPNGQSGGLRIFGDRWWHLEDPTHRRFFSPGSIQACLCQAGFVPLRIKAPLADSLSLEINSLMRYFYRQDAVMDHALVRFLDLLLMPAALLARWLWPRIRPNLEILAQKS